MRARAGGLRGVNAARQRRTAEELLDFRQRARATIHQELLTSADAVAEAKRPGGALARGPIVIADTQDNPGGGGHGDTTELLSELVRQQARGALVCLINDGESAAECHAAGEGATVTLALGGKSDGMPYHCSAQSVAI